MDLRQYEFQIVSKLDLNKLSQEKKEIPTHLKDKLFDLVKRGDESKLSIFLYECCVGLILKETDRVNLGFFFKSFLKDEKISESLESLLADLLWLLANQIENRKSDEWVKLCKWTHFLAEEKLVLKKTLQTRLDLELLHGAHLIGSSENTAGLSKKIVRQNTKNLYTQQKYNLLREESEGYSKLISLLTHTSTTNHKSIKKDLLSLIGFFDLDPNRVLDVILEIYEENLFDDEIFRGLLTLFKGQSLPHILGFKFQFYQNLEPSKSTPQSLYRLVALLVAKECVSIEDIYPHLIPSISTLQTQYQEFCLRQHQKARTFGIVNLSSKKDSADSKKSTGLKDRTKLRWNSSENQFFGLLSGLLEIGSFEYSLKMLKYITEDLGINPLYHAKVRDNLLHLIDYSLKKMYEPLSMKNLALCDPCSDPDYEKYFELCNKSSDVPDDDVIFKDRVLPLLLYGGSFVSCNPLLITKIVRILAQYDFLHNKKEIVFLVLEKVILPSLSCGGVVENDDDTGEENDLQPTPNPFLNYLVWDLLLKPLTYEERYNLYASGFSSSSTNLCLLKARVQNECRSILRRLTTENVKEIGRQFVKVAHSNPLILFDSILFQIESYDNIIQPIVDSLRFISPLGMDVLSYALLKQLSSNSTHKSQRKESGNNTCDWLQYLACFIGSLYRKYPLVELVPILEYLLVKLSRGDNSEAISELIVLEEILSKMGATLNLEPLSEEQVMARAGGPSLVYNENNTEFLSSSSSSGAGTNNSNNGVILNRRAIPKLVTALVKSELVLPFYVVLNQQRQNLLANSSRNIGKRQPLKLIGQLYDTVQMAFNQLVRFCDVHHSSSSSSSASAVFQTNWIDLTSSYQMAPELAFFITRDRLRANLFQHIKDKKEGKKTEIDKSMWMPVSGVFLSKLPVCEDGINSLFYSLFWTLKLYDIYVPHERYDAETSRIRQFLSTISSTGSSSEKKMTKKYKTLYEKLRDERKLQVKHRSEVFSYLNEQKGLFFAPSTDQNKANVLLSRCVVPRVLLSAEDALFVAKFIYHCHSESVPYFSTLQYYHNVISQVACGLVGFLCLSEREATNLGTFLKETLSLLSQWYSTKKQFAKEACFLGFSKDLQDAEKLISHSEYKQIYLHWHQQMEKSYLLTLSQPEYLSRRTTLIVLTTLIDVFPTQKKTADSLLMLLHEKLLTNESRQDLTIMAKRYSALLCQKNSTILGGKITSMNNFNTPPLPPPLPDSSSTGSKATKSQAKKRKIAETTTTSSDVKNKKQHKSGLATSGSASPPSSSNASSSRRSKKATIKPPPISDGQAEISSDHASIDNKPRVQIFTSSKKQQQDEQDQEQELHLKKKQSKKNTEEKNSKMRSSSTHSSQKSSSPSSKQSHPRKTADQDSALNATNGAVKKRSRYERSKSQTEEREEGEEQQDQDDMKMDLIKEANLRKALSSSTAASNNNNNGGTIRRIVSLKGSTSSSHKKLSATNETQSSTNPSSSTSSSIVQANEKRVAEERLKRQHQRKQQQKSSKNSSTPTNASPTSHSFNSNSSNSNRRHFDATTASRNSRDQHQQPQQQQQQQQQHHDRR